MSNHARIPIARLNEFTKALMLGYDPGPMTPDEKSAFNEIKAQIEREPGVAWGLVEE